MIVLGCLIATGSAFSFAALAAPQHAIAMHGEPKYPSGFKHFDYANPEAPQGGTLVLGAVGTFDSLNPFLIRGVAAQGRNLVTESLMMRGRDEPFTLYARLAESIEVPRDRSWVIFRLNPRARFSDGQPVTVDDVIFSLETLRDHGRPNHHAYYSQVSRIERIGKHGVKFVFDGSGDRELPLILGLLPVLPKHHLEGREFDRVGLEPIPGSGPYVIEHIDPGRSITYVRNPDYWGNDLPANRGRHNFERVRFDYFRDDSIALEAFVSGDVDLRIESSPVNWRTAYKGTKAVTEEIAHGQPSGMRGLVFNTRRPVFAVIRVRKALVHAFDFEWMNENLFFGAYHRTESFFDNSELEAPLEITDAERRLFARLGISFVVEPAFMQPLSPLPVSDASGTNRRNLAVALKLLEEAGWHLEKGVLVNGKGKPFAFEIMLINAGDLKIAQQFARDLARLGIKANVRIADDAQYQMRLNNYDFDMVIYDWGQSLSPGNEQAFYWGSEGVTVPGTRNYMGVADPVLDAVIERIPEARTREDLVTAVRLVDRILRSGHYVVPLFHSKTEWVAYHPSLGRPDISPAMGVSFETWWKKPVEARREKKPAN